jgi:hypothetical protein
MGFGERIGQGMPEPMRLGALCALIGGLAGTAFALAIGTNPLLAAVLAGLSFGGLGASVSYCDSLHRFEEDGCCPPAKAVAGETIDCPIWELELASTYFRDRVAGQESSAGRTIH